MRLTFLISFRGTVARENRGALELENTDPWRTEVPARFIDEQGLEKTMFEAADPAVFEWYVRNYGYKVNLFVDHSQIVQLECLRSGIWGTEHTWGRIRSYYQQPK